MCKQCCMEMSPSYVNCTSCLFPTVQIQLERNTYTASEVNQTSEEICAVLIAASNTDINVISVLMEIGITTIVGTITPREGGANAATGKFVHLCALCTMYALYHLIFLAQYIFSNH